MASRQDHLDSHRFAVRRVVTAFVTWDSDPGPSPFRHVLGATLVGVLITALGVGGAAAWAVISPGASGKWRNDRAIIVEAESGALFVYRDEVLHPVLNQASALLILNTPGARTVTVHRAALADAPRGATLGIPGAPASLPTATKLRTDPWIVCSEPDGSVLFVGGGPGAGTPLGSRGLLVTGPDQAVYLLWRGHKHLIRQPGAVLSALVWSGRPRVAVAQALLHAVPAGPDLVTPAVADRGRSVSGGRIGQLFGVRTGDRTDAFVLTSDGLAAITPLQAALLLAAPETAAVQGRRDLIPLTAGEFAALVQGKQVRPLVPEGTLPAEAPELVDAGSSVVCTAGDITVDAPLPDLTHALSTGSTSSSGSVLADRVVVAPGSGALVRTDTGVLMLVTDVGRRHVVPVPDVLPALGYEGRQPVGIPAELVALLPAGPALDAVAAAHPQ